MGGEIRYARSPDGTAIAHAIEGSGPVLVHLPTFLWMGHLERELDVPEVAGWLDRVGTGRSLVRYDARASGLSDRDPSDLSLDAHVSDLEMVVEAAGGERVSLFASVHACPVAVAYAARHPDRVSHLALWCPYDSGETYFGQPEFETLLRLVDNWELFSETLAHTRLGWTESDSARRLSALIRDCTEGPTLTRIFEAARAFDVRELLPGASMPSLVLQRRDLRYPDVGWARRICAALPEARLVLVEGETLAPYVGDVEGPLRALDDFLPRSDVGAAPESDDASPFRAIVFTDVEASTELTERVGDERARAILREHEVVVRDVLARSGGREVKALGDGFMAVFTSAGRALLAAQEIQRGLAAGAGVRVRIGVNAGEPIEEADDVYGSSVNLAARVSGAAKGGEILVTGAVRDLVRGREFSFTDRGSERFKGFAEAIGIFELEWDPEPVDAPTSSPRSEAVEAEDC